MNSSNADEIADNLNKKNPVSKVSRIKAGKHFIIKLRNVIKEKAPVAVESTLAGKYLIKILKSVKKSGYRISIIYFFVDTPEIALARIKSRVQAGGHDVPKNDVIRRFDRSKINFWEHYKNIADEWTLFYNGIEKLIPVATGEKSSYEIIDEALFKLFKRK